MSGEPTQTCGRFLVEARKERGFTQAELAERADMTQANISRIERDKVSPSISTLNRLLEAMGQTLTISAVSLSNPPPGGGNVTVDELRADYEGTTQAQRIEQASLLTNLAGELAASRNTA